MKYLKIYYQNILYQKKNDHKFITTQLSDGYISPLISYIEDVTFISLTYDQQQHANEDGLKMHLLSFMNMCNNYTVIAEKPLQNGAIDICLLLKELKKNEFDLLIELKRYPLNILLYKGIIPKSSDIKEASREELRMNLFFRKFKSESYYSCKDMESEVINQLKNYYITMKQLFKEKNFKLIYIISLGWTKILYATIVVTEKKILLYLEILMLIMNHKRRSGLILQTFRTLI